MRTRTRYRRKGKRHNRRTAKKSSFKSKGEKNVEISNIVGVFLDIMNTIKIYHWNTHSFSQHKATDELYEKLNNAIDTFVETLLGKDRIQINNLNNRAHLVDTKNVNDFKQKIHEYRDFLIDMNRYLDPRKDSDLFSIRDEILGDINQFLYLMTFDK